MQEKKEGKTMTKAKKLLSVFMASAMVLSSVSTAFACTGIYVGKDFSANGSTYMGRSEDIGDLYGKMFGVAEAAEHDADEIYADTYGFKMTYGEFPTGGNTYRYTSSDPQAYDSPLRHLDAPNPNTYICGYEVDVPASAEYTIRVSMNKVQ